jgi:hypothetical protein
MAKNKTHFGAQVRATQHGAIAFMDLSAAAQYKPAKDLTPVMSQRQLDTAPWACWGKDNLMPQKMVADISGTGILSGIIDGKTRFALCEGMLPAIVKRDPKTGQRIIESYVDDEEINMFMDLSDHYTTTFGMMKDQIGLGSGAARLMLNRKMDKVAAMTRADFSQLRFEKMDTTGKINNVFFAADWDKIRGKADKFLMTRPLLDPFLPVDDLQAKAANKQVEHVITFNHPSWGCSYYPPPLWYAAHKWVEIAQGVPEMKAAMFENSMLIKYVVVIYDQYWADAYPDGAWDEFDEKEKEVKRNALFDDIEKFLIGASNAHKTLFVDGKRDVINGHSWQNIEIKVIDNKTLSGDMLPDAAAANSEIAFSMLFNPAIIGASMPSGPYTNSQGGSSVRESVLLQIMIHELERRNIARVMNVIKWFNGWATRLKGLEFIIQGTALTTLDTGGSTKPVTLGAGGADSKDQNQSGDNTATQDPKTSNSSTIKTAVKNVA